MTVTELIAEVRRVWFTHEVQFKLQDVVVGRFQLEEYGGPRRLTSCVTCALAEWQSRIHRVDKFTAHSCSDTAKQPVVRKWCARASDPLWLPRLRDYNFTLGVDPGLPGLRCLFVTTDKNPHLYPGGHAGTQIWRKRLSPFQLDFCTPGEFPGRDISQYNVLILQSSGWTPILKGFKGVVILYGHDHHRAEIGRRVKEVFAAGQVDALFTPYPSIWVKYMAIPKRVPVVFTPFLDDPFWAQGSESFASRPLDVFVIGTTSSAYAERIAIHALLSSARDSLPFTVGFNKLARPQIKTFGNPDSDACYKSVQKVRLLNAWSEFLSTARIAVFGQDNWGYLVAKHAEVLGASSLLVCSQIPDLALLGLKPGVHYIPIRRPVEKELIPQLSYLVKNFSRYQSVLLAGHKWFQQYANYFLYEKFVADVTSLVEESLHVAR